MINPSSPTPPIELVADGNVITSRSSATPIEVPEALLAVLNEICEVVEDDGQVAATGGHLHCTGLYAGKYHNLLT